MTLWSLPLLPIIVGAVLAASGQRPRSGLAAVALATLAATLTLAVLAVAGGWSAELDWSAAIRLTAALTPVSSAVAILVPMIALPVIFHATQHENAEGLTRLTGLMLVFTGGMELVVVADDFLTLLIGWEIIGACSWALISHDWKDINNPRSGLYAFVMTRLGDLGLFVAAMALYAATGSFDFSGLGAVQGPYLELIAYGVLISAASKAGQAPFSPWLFRAMAGPSSVSALLHAATLVAAGVYLMARLQPDLAAAAGFGAAAAAIGLITALTGGVVAILQNHAKKLLAASTSAQLGFMFIAVGAGYPGIAVLHLIAHAAFKAPLFLSAGLAGDVAGGYRLDRMRLGRSLPWLALLTGIAALALAGTPPLGGGWTKEEIVTAVEQQSFWLALLVMVGGAMSAAYATRFQLLAYGRGEARAAERPAWSEAVGPAVLSAMTLGLGLLWVPRVGETAARWVGADLPEASALGLGLSLSLLAAGIIGGTYLVRHHPEIGRAGATAAAADWLGLPTLITIGVVRPFDSLAAAAARFDDRVIDAGPRGVAALARRLPVMAGSADNRAVDGGIRLTAAFAEWLARTGDRFGEAVADGFPEGVSRLVGMAARDMRRLQTGLSHHYYAYAIGGTVAVIAILAVGA